MIATLIIEIKLVFFEIFRVENKSISEDVFFSKFRTIGVIGDRKETRNFLIEYFCTSVKLSIETLLEEIRLVVF